MSSTRRFFVENIRRETELVGDAFAHARSVLRLREGDEVVLFDGSGKEYTAIVARAGKNSLLCNVLGERICDKDARTPLCLCVGALKGDKTELVVQKATELGVSAVDVFSSRYCAAYMNEKKLERLRKVAREAAEQCGRATVPAVRYFDTLGGALADCAGYKNKLFACEFAESSEADLASLSGSCALVVGSEGGFAPDEFEAARAVGFAGITLGRRILRAETAAIAFTAVVAYCLGELR